MSMMKLPFVVCKMKTMSKYMAITAELVPFILSPACRGGHRCFIHFHP